MAWNGAGGWVIFSQSRHVNFSRTVSITFHWRGCDSSVRVTSSPSLRSLFAAAAGAGRRRIDHHAFARKMVGERVAVGTLARKCTHGRGFGDGLFRRQFVLRGAGFRLFKRQRQLIDQTRRALRPLPINLALQKGDPQLLMRDQRRVRGDGLLRDKTRPPGKPPIAEDKTSTVVAMTLKPPPHEATHWTARAMAKVVGLAISTVQKIWKVHGLAPHRWRLFKLSNDPAFARHRRALRQAAGPCHCAQLRREVSDSGA
jgi:hypothetical protein